jgi:hypothetical protein
VRDKIGFGIPVASSASSAFATLIGDNWLNEHWRARLKFEHQNILVLNHTSRIGLTFSGRGSVMSEHGLAPHWEPPAEAPRRNPRSSGRFWLTNPTHSAGCMIKILSFVIQPDKHG